MVMAETVGRMIRISIGDLSFGELLDFGKRDDCCDILLPSDIRLMARKLGEQADEIAKLKETKVVNIGVNHAPMNFK
jgi:hypothetical protein